MDWERTNESEKKQHAQCKCKFFNGNGSLWLIFSYSYYGRVAVAPEPQRSCDFLGQLLRCFTTAPRRRQEASEVIVALDGVLFLLLQRRRSHIVLRVVLRVELS